MKKDNKPQGRTWHITNVRAGDDWSPNETVALLCFEQPRRCSRRTHAHFYQLSTPSQFFHLVSMPCELSHQRSIEQVLRQFHAFYPQNERFSMALVAFRQAIQRQIPGNHPIFLDRERKIPKFLDGFAVLKPLSRVTIG